MLLNGALNCGMVRVGEAAHSHWRSHSWELYVKMTSCFLSVWLKVLVPLLDKTRPLFALQRQLFIVHSSDGRGQRSMTALLCFSWLGWACPQDLRPCKAGWTSVWFCYLHTSTHKRAAFYWCARSSLLSSGQKQWPQRIWCRDRVFVALKEICQSWVSVENMEIVWGVVTLLSALMWINTFLIPDGGKRNTGFQTQCVDINSLWSRCWRSEPPLNW